jgi:hypothetical protein
VYLAHEQYIVECVVPQIRPETVQAVLYGALLIDSETNLMSSVSSSSNFASSAAIAASRVIASCNLSLSLLSSFEIS